ncbi:MAG: hypothetical protein OXT70_01085 [Chloroflexota bacterium]|nr:hypothetical protein [Chloroflexota bacterium]
MDTTDTAPQHAKGHSWNHDYVAIRLGGGQFDLVERATGTVVATGTPSELQAVMT